MRSEKLSERASKAARTAVAFSDAVNSFGPGFEERVRAAVRKSAAEEVEEVFQRVGEDIEKVKRQIALLLSLDSDTEVWVYAARASKGGEYLLSASKMKRESASHTAAVMRMKGAIYLQLEQFNNLINELKNQILQGKLDTHIHFTAQQLIYNKMAEY
jgi:VIT1/CCC1 family predicted Fe2+/Mn2+ transporter